MCCFFLNRRECSAIHGNRQSRSRKGPWNGRALIQPPGAKARKAERGSVPSPSRAPVGASCDREAFGVRQRDDSTTALIDKMPTGSCSIELSCYCIKNAI